MYNQQNQVERIQMEMALRQNQKAMNMPQMGGDAAYGSQPTHQKFESRNPLTGATDEYIKENAQPSSKRPPNNNIIHGGASSELLVDNKISAKVGQNMTQQQALQERSNSLVAKYRQKKEKDLNDQVYHAMIMGNGTPQRNQQVQRQGSSSNQMDQNRIFPAQDYARSSSENHLNRGKVRQQVVDSSRVAGIASKGMNSNNSNLIAMSGQDQPYLTSAQIYGKGQQSKPSVNINNEEYYAQMAPPSNRANGGKNGSSSDFVLGNPAYAEDQAVLNSRKQKPPRAPVVQSNLAMDVQAQRNAGNYAAQRNKASNVFN